MKFGLFTIVLWHESPTQSQALHDALEQIELADRLGLDQVWLGEHRFTARLALRVFSFAGTVVARTQKVRIGMAVVVLPLHNPILVAEEIAMLDVLSGGRVEIGLGSGYQRQEFDGLSIDMNESRARFREATEVLRKAWTEEPLTFHGKYTNVDNLWVLPKPLQKPHPPLYMAIEYQPKPNRVERQHSANPERRGPPISWSPAPPVLKMWRDQMEAFGHPHAHPKPAHVQGDLCEPQRWTETLHDDWPGRFFLAHSALDRYDWGHDWYADR